MSKTKTLLVSVLAVFGTAFFIPAQAQELVPPEQETQAVTVATVNIYDAQITRQDNNNIQLTFDLSNREQIQPDVRYAVQLMKDRQILMDEQIYPETISLNENETIKKEIEYLAPSYLSGEFQLMLIARNQNGLLLAIANPGQVILKGDNQFIEINPSSCYLTVADEAGDKRYTLDQGVDIKPEEQLIATCDLTNHANNPIIFIPNFKTYWRTTFGEEVTTNKEDRSTLTLNPQEKKQIRFTLPKAQTPQAYDTVLELQNEQNQTISNKLAFHYVLRGPSATIQNLRLDKDYYQKGQTAQASFFWSGSADNFPDSRLGATDSGQLTADITIKNADNQICAATQEALNPDSPTASYALPVKVDCPDPKIAVSIKDGQGNILDQKEFSIKSQTAPDQTKPQEALTELPATAQPSGIAGYIAIILLGLLALSILVFAIIKKRKGLPVIIFLVLAGGMFLTGGEGARADTFVISLYGQQNSYTVSLNKSSYAPGEKITAYGKITNSYCVNEGLMGGLTVTIAGSTKTMISLSNVGSNLTKTGTVTSIAPKAPGAYKAVFTGYFFYSSSSSKSYAIPYTVVTKSCALPWGGTIASGQ
ncbi:MAG: hypothetical protein Q8M12_02355, partial [bacterium]|nr:hypothetical protein [bacterium]